MNFFAFVRSSVAYIFRCVILMRCKFDMMKKNNNEVTVMWMNYYYYYGWWDKAVYGSNLRENRFRKLILMRQHMCLCMRWAHAVDIIKSAKFMSSYSILFPSSSYRDAVVFFFLSLYLILTTSDNVLALMMTPKTNRLVILITWFTWLDQILSRVRIENKLLIKYGRREKRIKRSESTQVE